MDGPIIDAEWEELDGVLDLTEEMIVKPKNYWVELLKEYWPLLPIIGWFIYRNAMRIASNYHYYCHHTDGYFSGWFDIIFK